MCILGCPFNSTAAPCRSLCWPQLLPSMIIIRKVRILPIQVQTNDNCLLMRPLPGMANAFSSSKVKKNVPQAKGQDAKRTRRDRHDIENMMFKLFETQPNWSLKQLVVQTDQPEQFLKEILNDLCVYNKRGPDQGTHELKPEYKKSSDDMDTAS